MPSRGLIRPLAGSHCSCAREEELERVAEDEDRDRDPEQGDRRSRPPSGQRWAWRAANRPSGIPRPIAKRSAAAVSSIVAGKRRASSSMTGRLLMTLLPRSTVRKLTEVDQVLGVQRLVEAHLSHGSARRSSGVACWPRRAATGSPGSRWTKAKTTIDRPKRTGIAARSLRIDVLQHAGIVASPRMVASPRGRSAAGGRPKCIGDASRRNGHDPLAVEPDRIERLVQVAGSKEALDVGTRCRRRLGVHERHRRVGHAPGCPGRSPMRSSRRPRRAPTSPSENALLSSGGPYANSVFGLPAVAVEERRAEEVVGSGPVAGPAEEPHRVLPDGLVRQVARSASRRS